MVQPRDCKYPVWLHRRKALS